MIIQSLVNIASNLPITNITSINLISDTLLALSQLPLNIQSAVIIFI
jgi:hypothetical protein